MSVVHILFSRFYQPPVLVYHAVLPDPARREALSLSSFSRQMEYLRGAHRQVLPLEALLSKRRPAQEVYLTFDDGVISFYESAWPVLKQYRYPACVFVIAERIGMPGYMDKEQLKELTESGLVTVGSHTMKHRYLPELDQKEMEDEVAASKSRIEEAVCRYVNFLAYPWGGFDERVKEAVKKAGYLAAFTTNQGFRGRGSSMDLFAVKRMTIAENETGLGFAAKSSGFGTCFSRAIKE